VPLHVAFLKLYRYIIQRQRPYQCVVTTGERCAVVLGQATARVMIARYIVVHNLVEWVFATPDVDGP